MALIEAHADKYSMARSKLDKGVVIASLVDSIRDEGILFVKKDAKTQCWVDIGEYKAREKTSHAMRDHISRSSTTGGNNTQQSQSIMHVKEAQQKKQRSGNRTTIQQPTVCCNTIAGKQNEQPYPNVVSSSRQAPVVASKDNGDTACKGISDGESIVIPSIFQRLGLDYFSFLDEGDNKESTIYPTHVASKAQDIAFDTFESTEEDEMLEWSKLFPMDEDELESDLLQIATTYAYAA
jgi:hypothetical protein